jgi:hypothetical protein
MLNKTLLERRLNKQELKNKHGLTTMEPGQTQIESNIL